MQNRNDHQLILIHLDDTVAVAPIPLVAGSICHTSTCSMALLTDIPAGHKVALRAIKKGENIVKYGSVIGHALEDIAAGAHVPSHNLATNLSGIEKYRYTHSVIPLASAIS